MRKILQSRSGNCTIEHNNDYLEKFPGVWKELKRLHNKSDQDAILLHYPGNKLNKDGLEQFLISGDADYAVVVGKLNSTIITNFFELDPAKVEWNFNPPIQPTNFVPQLTPGPQVIILFGPPQQNKHLLAQTTGLEILDLEQYSTREEIVQAAKEILHQTPPQGVIIVGRNPAYSDRRPFIILAREEQVPVEIWWMLGKNNCAINKGNSIREYEQLARRCYAVRFEDPEVNSSVPVKKVYYAE